MSPLAKLRALHEEVCRAWRQQSEHSISEGEAHLICLGFQVLERLAVEFEKGFTYYSAVNIETIATVKCYIEKVNAQFDDDADIVITGDRK